MSDHLDAVLAVRQQVMDSREYVDRLRQALQEQNLSVEEVERAMQPALSFHARLQEELMQLERNLKQ